MGGVKRLRDDLSRYKQITLDTMILIYVMERHPRYFSLAKEVLESIESGQTKGVVSAITLTELLTAPAQADDVAAMRDYELYLLNFPNLVIQPLDIEIARESAHMRARTRLPSPDAIILATARKAGADAIITNDRRWRNKLNRPDILFLDDYLD